jgi:RNA polymerase sigma-70 factor (ECF subfamily)
MLLQESRHAARTSPTGELILLGNQDRSLLEPGADRRGSGIAGESPEVPPLRLLHIAGCDCGPFNAETESVAATDWRQTVALTTDWYELSLRQLYS